MSSPQKLHDPPSPMTSMTEESDNDKDKLETVESGALLSGQREKKSDTSSKHRQLPPFEIDATSMKSKSSEKGKSSFQEDDELEDVSDILDRIPTTTKLYAGKTRDTDLDEMLGIDRDDPRLTTLESERSIRKRNVCDTFHPSSNGGREGRRWIPCRGISQSCIPCSGSSQNERKIGNIMILNQTIYRKTSFCLLGPHYLGFFFTFALLIFASQYFIRNAYIEVGPISTIICALFAILTASNLLIVSCSDPGVVKGIPGTGGEYEGLNTGEEEGWRYCDYCSVYQPPGAMHCPDCNVCVEGYDHHCPWMGICIGKQNYKAFMRFNLSWLTYLIYSVVWVTAIGPRVSEKSDPNL